MEPSLNWLWGALFAVASAVITNVVARVRENSKELADLRVHIAEKYTPTEDLREIVQALNEVRAELKQLRKELHDDQLSWHRSTKPQ